MPIASSTRRPSWTSPTLAVLGIAGCAMTFVLGACNNGSKAAKDLPDPPKTTTAKPAAEDKDQYKQLAADLGPAFEELRAMRSSPATDEPNAPDAFSQMSRKTRDAARGGDPTMTAAANQPASIPDSAAAPIYHAKAAMPERTLDQRRADAAAELALQFKPDISAAKEPLKAAMPLIALDMMSPGAGASGMDLVRRSVTPEQRKALDTARDLMRAFATDPNFTTADPAAMAQALRWQADTLTDSAGGATGAGMGRGSLSIGTTALCQRVEGFGRYTLLGSSSFIAGRSSPMILYTEIDNFTQTRGASGAPGQSGKAADMDPEAWTVEIGQVVKLYFDADGSEQVIYPESLVRDVSRSKRHDFFLVQRIDLPRNLSVGNYNLKITVRDVAGGAVAERSLPIRVIADASAASPERTTRPLARPETRGGRSDPAGAVAGHP